MRKEDGLGMGDVKMLAMIGAFLGWQPMLLTLVLASFAGALVGVAMIAVQRGSMKYALPFGTFLAVGALVAMLAGQPIIDWYVGLLLMRPADAEFTPAGYLLLGLTGHRRLPGRRAGVRAAAHRSARPAIRAAICASRTSRRRCSRRRCRRR